MYYCVSVPLFGVISKILEDLRKAIGIERFPSPNLGLSLKYYSGEYMVINNRFPSPNLGLSLKLENIMEKEKKITVSVPLFGVISKMQRSSS